MRVALAASMVLLAVGVTVLGDPGPASAQSTGSSRIEIVQTTTPSSGPCLPPALALRSSTRSDAETFRLTVTVTAPLCTRVNAVAAIYSMPGNGVAWPQTLVETAPFVLREPGVTEIIFTKTCDPEQFDVITGATPPTIAPWGPWHGPLLFPFDTSTSLQHWGCPPVPPTTTTAPTTTVAPTTTIADPCDDYTPTDLVVSPSTAFAGAVLDVSGSGEPGTMIQVVLRPPSAEAVPGGADFVALSDPTLVGPDGTWATTIVVPTDAVSGTWTVAAQAVGCETESTAEVTINEPGGATTVLGTLDLPEVAGLADEAPLDAEVLGNNELAGPVTGGSGPAGSAAPSGLAFTGTSVHVLVALAVLALAAGTLILLSTRRRV